MTSEGLIDLSAVADVVVNELEAAPGAAAGAAFASRARRDDPRRGVGVAGHLSHEPSPPVTPTTLFDLASVTKPVTALTFARLERRGVIRRDQPLRALVPELSDTASAAVPLDLLMAHRAGLHAHIEFFVQDAAAQQRDRLDILREAANARRADCRGMPPVDGFPPLYSDLGYMLVALAIERAADLPLDEAIRREVAAPLGLRIGSAAQLVVPREPSEAGPAPVADVAATEVMPWRGGLVQGAVHDQNAWVLAGLGVAGHAGTFGDVGSVVDLGRAVCDAYHDRSDWLARRDLEPLVRRRPGGSHCAGFDRKSGDAPSSGRYFGDETFGHLGFTGTSLWIDPVHELVGVLLTNRVCPTRDSLLIRAARPAAYDALYAAMCG